MGEAWERPEGSRAVPSTQRGLRSTWGSGGWDSWVFSLLAASGALWLLGPTPGSRRHGPRILGRRGQTGPA